jgi:hypothetical protein
MITVLEKIELNWIYLISFSISYKTIFHEIEREKEKNKRFEN